MIDVTTNITDTVRGWVRDRLEAEDEVNASRLTEEAVEHFKEDPGFIDAVLRERLLPTIHELTRTELKRTRHADVFVAADGTVETLERRRARLRSKWRRFERWMEYDGVAHKRLTKMRRDELLRAASARKKRASTEANVAGFLEMLAKGLAEGQSVEDHYAYEELEALWAISNQTRK